MEPEKSFKERVFDLLHESQSKLRYRMLTSSKRKLAEDVDKIYIELIDEYISKAIDATEASWLEAREAESEIELPEPETIIHPEPEVELPWWQKRIFVKKS